MASFNRVILMGNLTRDPEIRTAGASGIKVATLRLAVSEKRKDRNGNVVDNPVFVDVDAWDKTAELCGQYLKKGSPILVEGRLQMDSWEKDGVKQSKLKVRAVTLKFLSARPDSSAPAPAAPAAKPAPAPQDDEDLPF